MDGPGTAFPPTPPFRLLWDPMHSVICLCFRFVLGFQFWSQCGPPRALLGLHALCAGFSAPRPPPFDPRLGFARARFCNLARVNATNPKGLQQKVECTLAPRTGWGGRQGLLKHAVCSRRKSGTPGTRQTQLKSPQGRGRPPRRRLACALSTAVRRAGRRRGRSPPGEGSSAACMQRSVRGRAPGRGRVGSRRHKTGEVYGVGGRREGIPFVPRRDDGHAGGCVRLRAPAESVPSTGRD
jgi:hypothetical protein